MKSVLTLLLQRVAQGPVYFTHAVDEKGRETKVVRSTTSPTNQKHLHALALEGYVAETVTGTLIPQETTVTYTLTAKGREFLGLHAATPRPVHRSLPLSDKQLEAEGIE